MNKKSCLGVILSGGRSTRMGGKDKALLRLGGEFLVSRAVRRLRLQVDSLIINSSSRAQPFAQAGPPRVNDLPETAGKGPLAGILSAMCHAQAYGYQAIVTVAVDTPFFPDDYVGHMLAKSASGKERPVIASTLVSLHPTFGLWPVALHEKLHDHLSAAQENSILAFARKHDAQTVLFTPALPGLADPFFNVNTPADFTKAQALVAKIEERQH